VDSVDALSRAVTIIKREMSFVQGAKSGKQMDSAVAKKLQSMAGALDSIIASAWIDSSSRSKLKAFMSTSTEAETEADDELSLHAKQPQAAVHDYESHSGGIVATLEDMKDKAEATLNDMRREEMKAKHSYEMIKQSLTDAVTTLNKEIDEATASSGAAQEKLAKAQGDLADTEAAKAADETYVSKLSTECSAKASEWDERQKSAADELAALAKGAEILKAKFAPEFIQKATVVKAAIKFHETSKKNSEVRQKVIAVLKKVARDQGNNSFGLMQIQNAAGADPFGKVRGLIESMIAKLEQQAQEEATQDAFCKEEQSKSAKKKETTQASVDKLQARMDAANAASAELKSEIATLTGELNDIAASTEKATAIRNAEHADYKVASKDFEEAAEAVTQALVVLKDYYQSGASFAQVQQAPEFGSAKQDSAHGILSILEVAESDFARLLAEAESSEAEAVEAYEALSQDNAVAKAKKETSVKAKTSEIKSIEVALTHHSEDYENTSSELAAVLDYIVKLKPQCESKAMSYEERKARRDAEVAGLQEALTILEGEDIPSFIQKRASASAFLAARK